MSRSIVLVEWQRYNEPIAQRKDALLYELMLLSLLYDEVLVQDEILVCSKRMARWFHAAESFRLLEELFAVGEVTLLKRPVEKYPQKLRDLAQEKPIFARSKHLMQFSVGNDGRPISYTEEQLRFQGGLESCLSRYPSSHRYAGSKMALGHDLMKEFADLLSTVLTDKRYKKWRESRFRGISPRMADDFVEFSQNPAAAIRRIRAKGKALRMTTEKEFNTALAVQAAATYSPRGAAAMQKLIETVFAVPFCQDEEAEGRYGRALSELPLPLADEEGETGIDRVVRVEIKVQIPRDMYMPRPEPGYAEVIQSVRENSGKDLRNAVARIGTDFDFARVERAWRNVADEIASRVVNKSKLHKLDSWSILASVGKEVSWGIIVDLMIKPHSALEPFSLLPKLMGAGLSACGDYVYKLRRVDLQRQEISEKLDRAVEFRCVDIPRLSPSGVRHSKRRESTAQAF